eukprot:gene25999-34599_t
MKTTYGNQSSIQNFHPPTPVPIPGGPAPICAPTNAYSNSIATHAGSNYYMPMQFSSNYMVAPYGAPALAPPLGPAYSMNYNAQAPNHLQYYPQNNAIRPPLPPAPVSYGSHTANRGYENVKNKNSSAMGNYQVAHRSNNNSSSIHHAPPVVPTSEVLFCEPCDKEFSTASSFEAHCKTHEPCRHPGCTFSASKKVVVAHFHGAHGLYSGSGFKTIDVEGQKFRVLLGTSPEEVTQWRADRKRKFPTAATAASKEEALAELKNAGGILPTENTGNRKRNRGSADDSTVSNNKKKKNNNNKRNIEHQSHYMPAESTSECVNNSNTTQNNNDISADKNTTTTITITLTAAKENELLGGEQASPGHTATGTDSAKRKNRCMHFGRGRCQSGDSCKYSHDFVPVVCQYFAKFACRNGSRCMNIHHGAKKGVKESKGSSDPSSAAMNTSSNVNSNSSSSDSCSAVDLPAKDNDDTMLQSPNQKDEPPQSSDVKQNLSKGGLEGEEEAGAGADKTKRSSSQLHTNTKQPSAPRTQPQKKKGGLQIPPPLAGGERGTLLRKLLESEIVSEESVVLQCLRYIVQSNFFNEDVVATIPVTITNSTSTSLDTEMAVIDATTVASLQQ